VLQHKITVEQARRNLIWVWIGINTVGKTPLAILAAIAWKRSRPGQKVAAFDPQGKLRLITFINAQGKEEKLVDKVFEEWDKDFADQLKETRDPNQRENLKKEDYIWTDYLLILDDYHSLCKNFKTPAAFADLVNMRKFLNIDMILITHSPRFIVEGVADYVTRLSIFFNLAKSTSYEKKITYHEKCYDASIIVNHYVVKFGNGDPPFFDYPNFPYIIVNNLNGKMQFVNMTAKNLAQLDCFKTFEA
jgi:hypothetical protein